MSFFLNNSSVNRMFLGNREVSEVILSGIKRFTSPLTGVLSSLFSNNEPGFLFLADPETCFTDTAGTTQAEVGDPVALWLDQSGNDNHATQPTSANRPILGRKPKGGRRNFLERTEEFDDAVWNVFQGFNLYKEGGVFVLAPDIDNDFCLFEQIAGGTAFGAVTTSFSVKSFGFRYVQILSQAASHGHVNFDLQDGTVTRESGDFTGTIVDEGDGWFRIAGVNANSDGTNRARISVIDSPTANRLSNVSGDGTDGIFIRNAQLEFTPNPTPYQRVTDRFDVTEAGKPDRHYLFLGGASDPRWMQTPVIEPGTDKVQVFAGVRKLSDDAVQALIDTSDRWDQNDGAFMVRTTRLSTLNNPTAFSKGTGGNDSAIGPATPAPASIVITATGDIAAPDVTIRVNEDETSSGDAQGTGNYLAYPSYIGARGPGTAHHLDGEIYALTARFGPNLDNNQIELVERFTASKVAEATI